MTTRTGGAAFLSLAQSLPSFGRTLAETALRQEEEKRAEAAQQAEEAYRTASLGIQRDQLAQGDRHFGETLRQNYVTHGFDPGDGDSTPSTSTGDALLDAANRSSLSPISFGTALQYTALGRPTPHSTTPRYNPDADPDVVRQRAHDAAQASEAAADRANRVDVARISAGSREKVAGMRGAGGGHRVSREERDNANGIAAALVQQHGGLDGADRAAAAMPPSPQKDLVVASLHDLRYDQVHHSTVTPARPARRQMSMSELRALLEQPGHH